jgi:hypothetical protein
MLEQEQTLLSTFLVELESVEWVGVGISKVDGQSLKK